MTMKRPLQHDTDIEKMAMANCLMLLSRVQNKSGSDNNILSELGRLFHCKTCNKPFRSFQALGGHRASHKRPKLNDFLGPMPKSKMHECSVCGQEFAMGQALGGHMRRHRDEAVGKPVEKVVKKESGTRGLCLDLNLMPYDIDLKLWPIVT
ncbi:zinc finger protein ZAT12-like [Bidens hawaiensis]|uniref:zinc finger protein ZAT12-like n=1 Tax=Bidens hawaiensis TaxID=980011 RepID=UPI00404A84B7